MLPEFLDSGTWSVVCSHRNAYISPSSGNRMCSALGAKVAIVIKELMRKFSGIPIGRIFRTQQEKMWDNPCNSN